MSNWAVFITAERFSPKALNRALLLIQDFEYSAYPADSRWMVLTSTDLTPAASPFAATALPFEIPANGNAFAGMSLTEINTFVRANQDALQAVELSAGDWLVIDQKGLETSTALVCEQYYNSGEEEHGGGEEGLTDEFRACRIPYEQAWIMITNLDIANMDFEDFVDEEAGKQEDGSWKWMSFTPDEGRDEGEEPTEPEVKREKALKELREGGHAD
ncbi:hypothetical protein DFH09DRAFT_1124027 [Mycena vulgaris]|nr:hypothetical protein DFH09DRAFT_1124027 [Mycena vulgaris]